MSDRPWGPHGPVVPPHSVTPNPTAPDPVQPVGSGDQAAWPPPSGVGTGEVQLDRILSNIIVSLVMVTLLWIPIACLYPLTSLAGAAAGLSTFQVMLRLLPADGRDVAAVLGVVAAVVAFLVVYRIELRLAEHASFRMTRHAVRLVLLGVWAIPIIQLSMGVTAPSTSTRFILATVTSPRALAGFLSQPTNLAIWVAVLAGLHFLIWSGKGPRAWWHRRLGWVGLK